MLTIDVNLLNNPVLITCPTQRLPSEQRESDHLTGYVLLINSAGDTNASAPSGDVSAVARGRGRPVCIGGVKVVWQVTVQQANLADMAHGDARDEDDERLDESGQGGLWSMAKGKGKGKSTENGKSKSKGRGKGKGGRWGEKVVIDQYETDVVGPMTLQPGETRLEFGISVRPEIELSRVSRFDRIQHTLHGTVLALPPGYTSSLSTSSESLVSPPVRLGVSSSSGSSFSSASVQSGIGDVVPSYETATSSSSPPTSTSETTTTTNGVPSVPTGSRGAINTAPGLLGRWRSRFLSTRGHPESTASSDTDGIPNEAHTPTRESAKDGTLARCARIIPVWSLDISGEYNWMHSVAVPKMAGVGVRLAISSDALVLGGALTASLTLTRLPPDMTIHAVALNLVQTTYAPRKPHAPNNPPEVESDRACVVDEWTLAELGKVPISQLAGRKAPEAITGTRATASATSKQMMRGGNGKASVMSKGEGNSGAQMDDIWRHGRSQSRTATAESRSTLVGTDTTLDLTLSTRLPSPLLGAASTTEHPEAHPECLSVTLSHAWSLVIHFSQLGTDIEGEPLTADHYAVRTSIPRDSLGLGTRKGAKELKGDVSQAAAEAEKLQAEIISKMEGAVRSWTLEKGVVVGSDVALGKEVVAPTYEDGQAPDGRNSSVDTVELVQDGIQSDNSNSNMLAQKSKHQTPTPQSVSYYQDRPSPPLAIHPSDPHPPAAPALSTTPTPHPGSSLQTRTAYRLSLSPNINRSGFHPCALSVRRARLAHISDWPANGCIALPQRRSHVLGLWTFLRRVERSDEMMQRKVEAHWEETGGLCACFRDYEKGHDGGQDGGENGGEGQGSGGGVDANVPGQGQGRGAKYEVVDSEMRHVR